MYEIEELNSDIAWLDAPIDTDWLDALEEEAPTSKRTPAAMSPPPLQAGQSSYTQPITIRLPRWLIAQLKREAIERGEKYQTLINLILHQHAVS